MKKELWVELSDEQSEKVVGGVGSGSFPGAGVNGWSGNGHGGGLFHAGFSPGTQNTAGVWVPGDKS